MRHLIATRRAAGSALLSLHLVAVTGCTSWKNRGADVATVITPAPAAVSTGGESSGVPGLSNVQPVYAASTETARLIRITTSRGTTELRNPRVANDSVYGQQEKDGPETAVALSEVTKVETHGVSAGRTIVLVVGVTAASLIVATGIVVAASCGDVVFGC